MMLELTRAVQPADVTPTAVLAGMAEVAEVALLRWGRSGLALHAAVAAAVAVAAFWWAEKEGLHHDPSMRGWKAAAAAARVRPDMALLAKAWMARPYSASRCFWGSRAARRRRAAFAKRLGDRSSYWRRVREIHSRTENRRGTNVDAARRRQALFQGGSICRAQST